MSSWDHVIHFAIVQSAVLTIPDFRVLWHFLHLAASSSDSDSSEALSVSREACLMCQVSFVLTISRMWASSSLRVVTRLLSSHKLGAAPPCSTIRLIVVYPSLLLLSHELLHTCSCHLAQHIQQQFHDGCAICLPVCLRQVVRW